METALEYVNMTKAVEITGRSANLIMRLALVGEVRRLMPPGQAPRYCVEDLKKIPARRRPAPAA